MVATGRVHEEHVGAQPERQHGCLQEGPFPQGERPRHIPGAGLAAHDRLRTPHDRRLRNRGMFDESGFHFHRSYTVSGDIQDIIHSTEYPEVSLVIAFGSVAGEVEVRRSRRSSR
jgi:hypothetical protein